jgi:hypothetical protein
MLACHTSNLGKYQKYTIIIQILILTFSPVPFAKASSVSLTCTTRSFVGSTINARNLGTIREERICTKGMAYDSVLPDPVGAEMRWSGRGSSDVGIRGGERR